MLQRGMQYMKMTRRNEYDDEPVLYCKRCLSLKIKSTDGDENNDYCADCGSTIIHKAPLEAWDMLYQRMYHKPFLSNEKRR